VFEGFMQKLAIKALLACLFIAVTMFAAMACAFIGFGLFRSIFGEVSDQYRDWSVITGLSLWFLFVAIGAYFLTRKG
jgi:ABC-type uncharacterized transport system permease subunit